MKKATLSNAIEALIPNEIFIISLIDGKEVVEYKNPDKAPTEEAIQTKLAELQAEYDSKQYQRDRAPLYPNIGDQLDDLYKQGAFSDEMAAKIKKVKDDNPKPS